MNDRDRRSRLLEGIPLPVDSTDGETASGWLIELGSDPPRWWQGRGSSLFTHDAFEAMRFARAEDAQRAIAWLVEKGVHEGCKAVEHGFIGGQKS
jgi:hypothetical protein